jgi:MtrB/PioB family decaheme-associated outer membrane protein
MNMKLKIYSLTAVLMMLIPCSAVIAEEVVPVTVFSGEVTLQGQVVHVDGDKAKFDEHADTRDGFYGAVKLNYDNGNYFMRFNAEDIGYDTQRYNLEGGMWGKFKYNLFYTEMPNNTTFDARTFYSKAGDTFLSVHGDPDNINTWSSFDYKTERKRFGAGVSLDMLKPFFFSISADREKREGIKPTSFGSIFAGESLTELPEPINYRTDSFRIEGGYSKKPFFASLTYMGSKFTNHDQNLYFEDVFSTYIENVSLPPDNDYYKLSFKGALWLPYNSKLSLNAGSARAKSHYDGNDVTTIIVENFNGKVDTKNVDVVLTSNPVTFLDGKLFYNYYDRDNRKGDDYLGYTNNSYGGQFVFKLPQQFRFTLGYTRKDTDYHNRYDAKNREDDIYSADLAWSGLDFATFRIGYERLHRASNRKGTDAASEDELDTLWRFDVAPADRDIFKASVELFPISNLSVTLGYKYKNTDYEDKALAYATTGLGLRDYQSDQLFVDASYALTKVARFYGYFDYEKVRTRQYGLSSEDFTEWKVNQKEKNYDYGIGADFFIIPKKLTVKAQYDYVRSDGSADFSYLSMPTPAGSDIGDWGDYRKKAFSLKVIYDVTKAITLSAGYLYERYKLDDMQFDGYSYHPDATAYLTGAYKDQSYKANVIYLNATYKF